MISPNTILQGRYRIIQQLGAGGMGAVYQAMDESLSCVVAVKETFASTDEHRRAFKREAELLANLTHAALPRVTDHFTHDSVQFLVMQFIPGNDLAELLSMSERPFPSEKVLEWADQLLDALEELHSYTPPIIHRDIKPSNLKLTPKGKIILLDFGLAKGSAGQMSTVDADSSAKSIYGYTRYFAPLEQITGAGTDPRSDLYSLAATLWSLLTGELPPDALARVGAREESRPDLLSAAHEKNVDVPQAISAILHQAMSLNRNQRPASAAEMRQMLRDGSETQGEAEEEARRQREAEEAEAARRAEEERQDKEAEKRRAAEAEQRRTAEAEARTARQRAAESGQSREQEGRVGREGVAIRKAERDAEQAHQREIDVREKSDAQLEMESQWSARRKVTIGVIAGIAILALVVLIWIRQTGERAQQSANQNAAPTSPQQTTQPTGTQQTGETTNVPPATPEPSLGTERPGRQEETVGSSSAEAAAANISSGEQDPQKKSLTFVGASATAEGTRITITADGPLNEYSAYRSGDRYYVVIPEANAMRTPSGLSGRGFDDVQVQKRGNDVILSFRLQPGTNARVNQRSNKLYVELTAPNK